MSGVAIPETNIAPENGCLEYDRFLLGWPIFGGELLVSGSDMRPLSFQLVFGAHFVALDHF